MSVPALASKLIRLIKLNLLSSEPQMKTQPVWSTNAQTHLDIGNSNLVIPPDQRISSQRRDIGVYVPSKRVVVVYEESVPHFETTVVG